MVAELELEPVLLASLTARIHTTACIRSPAEEPSKAQRSEAHSAAVDRSTEPPFVDSWERLRRNC